jgi:hypothetical protein
MTEPRNCTRVDPISGAMGLKKQEINGQLPTCRPDNCTDTALHLVQKLYTLLIYQWVGRFRPLFYCFSQIKNHPENCRQSVAFLGEATSMYCEYTSDTLSGQ